MTTQTQRARQVLRKRHAAAKLNVHPATVMRWATDPKYADLGFPRPIQMADNSVGFLEHEIDAWLEAQPRVGSHRAA